MQTKTFLALAICMSALVHLSAQVVTGPPMIIAASSTATLSNVSCRAYVGTDENVAVAGFVVSGPPGSGIQVLVRGIGPTLSKFSISGVLASPRLTLYDSSNKPIATNVGWGTNQEPEFISSAAVLAGAFALPEGSADCAILVTLAPGNYTAVVSGSNNTSGVALVEVYGVPFTSPPPPVSPPPNTTPGSGT